MNITDTKKQVLVSLQTAAELMSIHKRSLYRLIASGEFPQPLKVGGSSRVLVSDIEQYIEHIQGKRGE